ncbi:MAG: hypothetical protein EOM03_05930 [Clostridia bacterium]|nr:hypothetical protein [Clostridia bacterium]
MSDSEKSRYLVSHTGNPDAEVIAESSMKARQAAAILWNVPWDAVALGCIVKKLGPEVEPEVIKAPKLPELPEPSVEPGEESDEPELPVETDAQLELEAPEEAEKEKVPAKKKK